MFSFSQQNWVSLLRSNINVMKKCNPNECRAGIDITYTTPIILGINNIYSLLNTMYQLTLQWPTKYSGDDPIYYIIHISLAWHCKFYMQTVMIILCTFWKALKIIHNSSEHSYHVVEEWRLIKLSKGEPILKTHQNFTNWTF